MSWLIRQRLKIAISLVVTVAFIWLLQAGALPFLPEKNALANVRWEWVVGYFVLWSLMHVLRAWRWRFLLDPIHVVPLRKLLLTSFVGFAAIVALPVRAGEFVRPALVREKGKLSGWSATGTVAAERITDGLVLSLILLFGIATSEQLDPLPEHIGGLAVSPRLVSSATYMALAFFAGAFGAMGVFWAARDFARELTRRIVGFFSPRLATWLADRVERVTDGLAFLPRLNYTLPFVLWTIAYWLLNAAATWVLARGCGLNELSLAQACVVTGCLALGIMVPNAPGFLGQFQFSVYAALSLFVPEQQLLAEGSVLVFFLYVIQSLIIFGSAAWAAVALRPNFQATLNADQNVLDDSPESEMRA